MRSAFICAEEKTLAGLAPGEPLLTETMVQARIFQRAPSSIDGKEVSNISLYSGRTWSLAHIHMLC